MANVIEEFNKQVDFSGVVEKVFAQKSDGWFSAKIRFDTPSTRKQMFRQYVTSTALVKCSGTCDFGLSYGMHIEFKVNGVNTDPQWGVQFAIVKDSIKAICDSAVSTWSYLKNANADGQIIITQAQARDMYARYKDKILDAIRTEPERELRKYCSRPMELKLFVIHNDLMAGLMSIHSEMTHHICNKAIERYGSKAYERVTENPYILAYELNWDMHKADAVACDVLNLNFGDQKRKDAMLVYAISHLCFKHNGAFIQLTDESIASIIAIVNSYMLFYKGRPFNAVYGIQNNAETVDWIRRQIDDDERLYLTRVGRYSLVYLAEMYKLETDTAELVAERVNMDSQFEQDEVAAIVDDYDANMRQVKGYGLDDIQKQAVQNSFTNSISVINGGAGTGKSTIIDAIIHAGMQLGMDKPFIMTPTHKAKKRVLEILSPSARTMLEDKNDKLRIMTVALYTTCVDLDTDYTNIASTKGSYVIVDEGSMLSMWQAAKLMKGLRDTAHIIIIGDYHQLPSIDPGCFFFDLCRSKQVPRTELINCYRTSGKAIVENSLKVNDGNAAMTWGDEFSFAMFYQDNYASAIADEYAQLVSDGVAMQDICCLSPVKDAKYPTGVAYINHMIQEKLNPLLALGAIMPYVSFGEAEYSLAKGHKGYSVAQSYDKTKSFRIGDRVVCEHNYSAGVTNGDTGMIIGFTHPDKKGGENDYSARVHIQFDNGMEHEVKVADMVRHFSLGYCLTVHKSQGSEYSYLLLSIPNDRRIEIMMRRELIYTAITRAKNCVKIYGSWYMMERAITTPPENRASLLYHRIDKAV